jgi:hypothetical protein
LQNLYPNAPATVAVSARQTPVDVSAGDWTVRAYGEIDVYSASYMTQ